MSNCLIRNLISFATGIKNGIEVTLDLSINVIDNFNDQYNFPHKLLLTDTKVSRLRKAFANNSSHNIKLSKIQLYKIGQSGGFVDRLFGPLLKTRLPLMKNVIKPLPKSVLILLGSTTATSARKPAIRKTVFESGMTKLKTSNEEMNDVMKIVKSFEDLVY